MRRLIAACALAVGGIVTPTRGGIAVVDQQRVVHASGQAFNEIVTGPAYSQTQIAAPFAAFDQSVSGSSQTPPAARSNSPDFESTSASQTSTLTFDGQTLHLVVNGNTFASAGNNAPDANSTYYVVFTLSSPTAYTLIDSTSHNGGVGDTDMLDQGARLLAGDRAPLFPTSPSNAAFPSDSLVPPLAIFFNHPTQTFTGTLDAGTYTLEGGAFGMPSEATAAGIYAIDFTLGAAASGSGSGTSAAPLPSAAWMGLSTIALLAGAAAWRRGARAAS